MLQCCTVKHTSTVMLPYEWSIDQSKNVQLNIHKQWAKHFNTVKHTWKELEQHQPSPADNNTGRNTHTHTQAHTEHGRVRAPKGNHEKKVSFAFAGERNWRMRRKGKQHTREGRREREESQLREREKQQKKKTEWIEKPERLLQHYKRGQESTVAGQRKKKKIEEEEREEKRRECITNTERERSKKNAYSFGSVTVFFNCFLCHSVFFFQFVEGRRGGEKWKNGGQVERNEKKASSVCSYIYGSVTVYYYY